MAFDANKLFGYVAKAIPLVVSAMSAVAQIKGASGSDKKEAVRANLPIVLGAVEVMVGDVANDAKVMETYDGLIEAIYAFDRAVKVAEAVAKSAKSIPTPATPAP